MIRAITCLVALSTLSLAACDNRSSEKENDSQAITLNNGQEVAELSTEDDAVTIETAGPMAEISFDRSEHDFGDMVQGEKVKTSFRLTNTGEAPLIITDTKVTCGCTVPSWPKEPIPPGETAEIEVAFNSAGKRGRQNKTVTLLANVPGGKSQVHFSAMVNTVERPNGPVAN